MGRSDGTHAHETRPLGKSRRMEERKPEGRNLAERLMALYGDRPHFQRRACSLRARDSVPSRARSASILRGMKNTRSSLCRIGAGLALTCALAAPVRAQSGFS